MHVADDTGWLPEQPILSSRLNSSTIKLVCPTARQDPKWNQPFVTGTGNRPQSYEFVGGCAPPLSN